MKKICLIGVFVSIFSITFSQNIAGKYKGTLTVKYHENVQPEVKPQSIVRLEKTGGTYTVVVSDMSFGNIKIKNFMLDSIETQKVKNTTTLIRYKIKDMLIPQDDDGTFIPAQAMLKSAKVLDNKFEMELWINTGLGLSLVVRFSGNKLQ